jgi:hypothetical protein
MAVKNPYEPPTYGVRNLAIERRIAGKPPASVEDDDADEDDEAEVSVKAEKAAPTNKARKAAPANKGKK